MSERYDFAISLRIWHPSMSPGSITRRLRLAPRTKKTGGAARRTPRGALLRMANGTRLGDVNPESYWVADVIRHGVGSVGRRSAAEQCVERCCKKLVRHAEFFRRIRRDGGHVRVWVDSHSRRNYTFEPIALPFTLLFAWVWHRRLCHRTIAFGAPAANGGR
jgi:hypothetical protein